MKRSHIGIALYQPDIPQNVGGMIRLCACLGAPLHLIEPCGFVLDDKRLKRAAMDYVAHVCLTRHASWAAFESRRRMLHPRPRLVLLTTKAAAEYWDFSFQPDDLLLLGRESCGVPEEVRKMAEAEVRIPVNPATRSLNVTLAAAMALSEAQRQTREES